MSLYSYNRDHKKFARSLRKNQTEAEKLLWSKLRARQLGGFKFRRQQPIGGYILDFYCEAKKLAIELDGSQHLEKEHAQYDRIRKIELQQQGITILRFLDNEVFQNLEGILEAISSYLTDLTPTLSSEEREK